MTEKGTLYVISAPSGAGKTTLVNALINTIPSLCVSISHTTRAIRPKEQDGSNYHFVTNDHFNKMVDQEDFLEHATVFGNSYGTSRRMVYDTLAKGVDVILEIDWQGSQQIQKLFPDCISIFILPPSLAALRDRLVSRNQDDQDIIIKRIADVKETARHIQEYQYVVVNDDFAVALTDLTAIIHAGSLIKNRQIAKNAQLLEDLITQE
jgi:guanylate kinase